MAGSIQPFGYTGYQADRIAGTYYAQAREYRAETGRFDGRDIIKGYAAAPYTLNEYGYCFGNPEKYVDNDGRSPIIAVPFTVPIMSIDPNFICQCTQWVFNNIEIVFTNRENEFMGIAGGYSAISATYGDGNLVSITIENGNLQAISLNLKGEMNGIKNYTSIGISTTNLFKISSTLDWNDSNGKSNLFGYTIGGLGMEVEWGQGVDREIKGNGFRIGLNLSDSFDFYNYNVHQENNIPYRDESGAFLNINRTGALGAFVVILGDSLVAKAAFASISAFIGYLNYDNIETLFKTLKDEHIENNGCEE